MTTQHPAWRLQGRYFETCNCEVACPCIWLQPPSEGECKLLVAWHIEQGHLGEQGLDGLNVALACHAPDNMIKGGWSAALYLDERADDRQTAALTQIFTGQVGGHPSVLLGLVSNVWGIRKVKIDYHEQGDHRSLSIPEIAEADIKSIQGITGGESSIGTPPLCVVPSHAATVAKSSLYRYRDHGQDWEFSERNGFHSPFVYQP